MYKPIIPPDDLQKMKVQPPRAKLPLARVPIGALKVSRRPLQSGINIPAATSLISHERKAENISYLVHEGRIVLYGLEPIRDGEVRLLEISQDLGEVVVGLLREDNVC